MGTFILDILIVISLGGILYLFARVLPRVSDEALGLSSESRTQWVVTYVEKTDEWIRLFSEKVLRRTKILVMKLDNTVNKRLNKFREDSPKNIKLSEDDIEEKITPEGEEEKEESTHS